MAWNEPGGNDRDPWGGKKNDGPPDLDDALKQFNDRLRGLFGGGNGGQKGGSNNGSSNTLPVVGLVLGLAAIIWALSGVYQVNEQERGVVLRLGKFAEEVGPGLQWNPPLIDEKFIHNVTEIRDYRNSGRMLTSDLNLVEVKATVQYQIGDIRKFVLSVNEPEKSLEQAMESALRHVIGASSMDQVTTEGRAAIASEARIRLQELMDTYDTGIDVSAVVIDETSPPEAVRDAFNDVSRALEDRDRLRREAEAYALGIVPIARGQAQRVRQEAEAYRERVIAEAEGETARFSALLFEYERAPDITRERMYLDMMQEVLGRTNKVLVDVDGGNNVFYLPLDRMGQSSRQTSRPDPNLNVSDLRAAQEAVESLRTPEPTSRNNNVREGRR